MVKVLLSIIFPFLLWGSVYSFYEYLCEPQHVFKPYLRIYKGRMLDLKLADEGPGLHVLSKLLKAEDNPSNAENIYVCVNGPAFMYYSKAKTAGHEVYVAPQNDVFVHHCEMHNVKPHFNATQINYELKLLSVMLYGDAEDYRKPAIQSFTAPYYFEEDSYDQGFPTHYQHATSIMMIGRSECTLRKGSDEANTIPLKFTNNLKFEIPADSHKWRHANRYEFDRYLCSQGFNDLRDAVPKTATPPNPDREKLLKKMQAMVNDEFISANGDCDPEVFNAEEFQSSVDTYIEQLKQLNEIWTPPGGDPLRTTLSTEMKAKINESTQKPILDVARIDHDLEFAKLTPKQKEKMEKRKIELQTKKIQPENDKFTAFDPKYLDSVKEALDDAEAKRVSSVDKDDAESARVAAESLGKELETLENEIPTSTSKDAIADKKKSYYEALRTAFEKSKAAYRKLGDWEMAIASARSRIFQAKKKVEDYKFGPPTKSKTLIIYPERSDPQRYELIDEKCVKLPRVYPDVDKSNPGECKKGKPEKAESCQLMDTTLGQYHVWKVDKANKLSEDVADVWKKEILKLTGEVFINACPYLPNRRKFVEQIHNLLGYYITNKQPAYFYQLPKNGTSLACRAFQDWKINKVPMGPLTPPDPNQNPEQREYWETIRTVLQKCISKRRRLIFKETAQFIHGKKSHLHYVWVKPGKNKTTREIPLQEEQAEKEYIFNWVIDMSWRIFSTSLGMCMPGYEKSVPDFTSRYYSMFTEDFLIPLREMWINPRHNIVFQWILGEFYNGDSEFWAINCMEASFMYAEREDWRPLRNLMVNCAAENNYLLKDDIKGYNIFG